MSMIEQLTHLVFRFGPFAFSLVFLLLLARWTQKKWHEVQTRADPPAELLEKRTLCATFVVTYAFGIILAFVSVYWWWLNQPRYFYEGRILEVSEVQTLDGESFFARNIYYPQTPIRDLHFLITQDEPFFDGQKISLSHVRDRQLEKGRLVLAVKLGQKPVYALVYNEAKQQWQLKLQDEPTTPAWFPLIPTAYADTTRPIAPISRPPVVIVPRSVEAVGPTGAPKPLPERRAPSGSAATGTPDKPSAVGSAPSLKVEYQQFALELQNSSTLVSRKIQIVDVLDRAPTDDLRALFQLRDVLKQPLREPAFVTLFDLTRHTDKELASKTKSLLEKAPLPTQYFQSALSSTDRSRISNAVNQFLRLEQTYADRIIVELEKQKVDVTPLKQVSRASDHWKLLIPTGTASGDRYYLKVQWDSGAASTSQCITSLPFVMARVPVEKISKPKADLLLYDTDKLIILQTATEVSRCGGTPTFVGFYPRETVIRLQDK